LFELLDDNRNVVGTFTTRDFMVASVRCEFKKTSQPMLIAALGAAEFWLANSRGFVEPRPSRMAIEIVMERYIDANQAAQ
jgi:hypothetical protein